MITKNITTAKIISAILVPFESIKIKIKTNLIIGRSLL